MTVETTARSEDQTTEAVARQILSVMGGRRTNQARLTREMGKPPMWLSERLNGKTKISVVDLKLIADALGVHMVDLLPPDERNVTVRYPAVPVTTREPVSRPRAVLPRSPLATGYPATRRPPNGPVNGRSSSVRTRPTGL